MGEGATLRIINSTGHALKKENIHSYQMNEWKFPEEISTGINDVYIEWDDIVTKNKDDDAGEARYVISKDHYFEIQAKGRTEEGKSYRHLNLVTKNGPTTITADVGWKFDGTFVFCIL